MKLGARYIPTLCLKKEKLRIIKIGHELLDLRWLGRSTLFVGCVQMLESYKKSSSLHLNMESKCLLKSSLRFIALLCNSFILGTLTDVPSLVVGEIGYQLL